MSNAVISIFACTPLDANLRPFLGTAAAAAAAAVAPKGALVASAPAGYWNEDTAFVCRTGDHAWLTALGAVWMAAFCVGFPIAMAAALWRVRGKLEEQEVRRAAAGPPPAPSLSPAPPPPTLPLAGRS